MHNVFVALLALALSGCTDGDDADTTPGGGDALWVDAPTWTIGDHWTYRTSTADGETSTVSLVVTAEEGSDYILDTDEPTMAYFHALEEISYLGKISKAHLAGSQGSDRVRYFDFPLEVNKTWSTNWDGQRVDVRVVHVGVDTAHLQATAGGVMFADYDYGRGFLQRIAFMDDAGEEAFTMELDGQGSGFSGTVYRYELEDLLTFTAVDAQMEMEALSLGETVNEIGIQVNATCGGAAAGVLGTVLTEREPDETHVPQLLVATEVPVYAFRLDCSQDQEATDEDVATVDPAMAYHLEYGASANGGAFELAIEPRTLVSLAVG